MSNIDITMRLNGTADVTKGLGQASAAISAFGKLSSAAAAGFAAASAAVAAAGAAFGAGLKDIVEYGGKLNDLSARIGTSVENLVIQEQAFKDAGLGADALAGAYGKLQNALESGFNGDSNVTKSFQSLGLSVDELINLDPGTQFERVGKAIGALPSATERSAAAMRLFGKSGAELIPLFRSGGAFDDALATLGYLPALMQRNAEVLDGLGDAFGRIPAKLRGLFAGFIDQLTPEVKKLTELINKIDLTGVGKKLGALVNVAIDQWNQGKFDEFIALLLEAGLEKGAEGAKAIWQKLNISLTDVLTEGAISAASIIVQVLTIPLQFVSASILKVVDHIRKAWELWGELFGGDKAAPAMSFGEAFTMAGEGARDFRDQIRNSAEDAKKLFGLSDGTRESMDSQVSAAERLNKLLEEMIAKREKEAGFDRELTITGKARRINPRNDIGEQMRSMLEKLDDQFGTLAEKIARVFKGITQSAVDGVAGSIRGLLTLTMSWGEALRNIGSSILNGVINAIAQMFAEWLVQMTLVQGLKRIFHAEDKVQAGITAATWAPAAATTNAATGGAFASIGIPLTLGLILAAVGTIAALAFADGGLTPGKPTLAMVGERGPELVLPAHVTSQLSQAQRASLVAGNFSNVPQSGGGSGKTQRIIIVSDDRKLRDLESDPAFENVVVRVTERNKWRFG